MKEVAYKILVRPGMEYVGSVWDPMVWLTRKIQYALAVLDLFHPTKYSTKYISQIKAGVQII